MRPVESASERAARIALKTKKKPRPIKSKPSTVKKDAKLRQVVRARDLGCVILRILSMRDIAALKREALDLGPLEVAHVEARSQAPSKKHDPRNAVLIHSLFHRRLTELRHPVTNELITKEEAAQWMQSAKIAAVSSSHRGV